jgi:hypothetical protein
MARQLFKPDARPTAQSGSDGCGVPKLRQLSGEKKWLFG